MAKRIKYIIGAVVVGLPLVVLAQQSANFRLIDGGLEANQHTSTSLNFRVIGSLEPNAGNAASNSFSVRSGAVLQPYCGNGIIDLDEICDGAQLAGQSCTSRGFLGGTLGCEANCRAFDERFCQARSGGGGGGGGFVPTPVGVPPAPTFDAAITEGVFTYQSTLTLSGTKSTDATSVKVNGSTVGVTYPSNVTWRKLVNLIVGNNVFSIVASNASGDSSAVSRTIVRRKMGDSNNDGTVNDLDLSRLVSRWGLVDRESDFNGDGLVNDFDLSLLVAFWAT